jgi:hypothetical protein
LSGGPNRPCGRHWSSSSSSNRKASHRPLHMSAHAATQAQQQCQVPQSPAPSEQGELTGGSMRKA